MAADRGQLPFARIEVGPQTVGLGVAPWVGPAFRAAGRELAAAAEACLDGMPAPAPRPAIGRPRLDRTAIVRRAMDVIDASQSRPTASGIAQRIGVNDRTLLRTFQETFGVPPKKYLMLRELHAVRRVLSSDPS